MRCDAGVAYLTETPAAEATPVVAAFATFWPSFPLMVTGQPGEKGLAFAELFIPFPEAISKVARTHADEDTRVLAATMLTTFGFFPLVMQHERWNG